MNTINQVDVLTVLNNLMGRRVLPGGEQDDMKRFCQQGFNYCWRYYKWGFSLATATLTDAGGGVYYLPTDFDYEGYRKFTDLTEVPLDEITGAAGSTNVALEWDDTAKRYKLNPGSAAQLIYQRTPPTLGTDAAGSHPFPSAQVVALAASVYTKQAENPTRADISQEWDLVHSELDRLVGRADAARPRSSVRNYHDKMGTFPGDVGR